MDVTYKVEGLEISEGDQLGLELGRCSYHGATGTPWQWSRRQAIYVYICSYTVALVYIHVGTCTSR